MAKIHAIEKLRKLKDGTLITPKNYDKQGLTEAFTIPFNGLSDAYRKLKNDNFGDYDNDQPVIDFIDQFTTVSLNEDEVGKKLVEMTREVNTHTSSHQNLQEVWAKL